MQTEAIFNKIAETIQQEILKAEHNIYVAVAWFTNKNIFNALVNRAENGVKVYLMLTNDFINENSYIEYEDLEINNSKVFYAGDGEQDLMHNKFCVIDNKTVITGSYNWSYKAESNFENIVITKEDSFLATQFIKEFNRIKNIFYPELTETEKEDFPIAKIIQRFEILKNLFLLEDFEDIDNTANKLDVYSFNAEVDEIIKDIRSRVFSNAVVKIQAFIDKYKQLNIWQDNELEALKLEIKVLENKLNAFDNEKMELEKFLSDFQHRHSFELGEIILEILKLRKLKYKDDKELFEEAEQDEKSYKEELEEDNKKTVLNLSNDEKKELKKKFRKATILCHPDKVNDEFKEASEAIFIELKDAYETNNLTRVSEILKDLQNGHFKSKADTIDKKDVLKVTIAQYKKRIAEFKQQIIEIKESATYIQIKEIENWDEYFEQTKAQLNQELETLTSELQAK